MADSPVTPTSVAVIGAGPVGLGASWLLTRSGYAVHLSESRETPSGHARTVGILLPGNVADKPISVDAGLMLSSSTTYVDLVSLFPLLNVEEEISSTSFSSSIHHPNRKEYFQRGPDDPATLFANPANLRRTIYAHHALRHV